MKAKIYRLVGTIEVEGTPEEVSQLVKALEGPSLSSNPLPWVSVPTPFVVDLCPSGGQHEYDTYIGDGPPPCKKCGQRSFVNNPPYIVTIQALGERGSGVSSTTGLVSSQQELLGCSATTHTSALGCTSSTILPSACTDSSTVLGS